MSGATVGFPEDKVRNYWRAERPFDPLFDGFDRLSALAMLREIERLRAENERLRKEEARPPP